jgi:hypothetical protein
MVKAVEEGGMRFYVEDGEVEKRGALALANTRAVKDRRG